MTVPPESPGRGRRLALAVVIALVVFGSGFATGWVAYQRLTPSPGSVSLDSVLVNISYAPGSLRVLGPSSSDACRDCPRVYVGGQQPWVFVFDIYTAANQEVWYNLSVWSPVPFFESSCVGFGPCPITHRDIWRNESMSGGFGIGWVEQLSVSNPAPSFPDGFQILCNVTINEVTY